MPHRTAALLALLAAALLAAPALHAQAPSDTARAPVSVGVRPIPAALYSPTKGVGLGAALVVRNLGWEGSELEVSAEPMTRFGRYGVRAATGSPFEAERFAVGSATYTTASRYPYFGVGPGSRRGDHVQVSFERFETALRLGHYAPGGRSLLVQPTLRLLHGRVRGFEDRQEGALERLDEASRQNLLRAAERPTLGVTYGLEAVLDRTDTPHYPTRGGLLQGSLRRYDGLDEDPARFWTGTAGVYGFLPLGRPTRVLEARAVAAVTREIGERPIPFYELPALDAELLGGYPAGRLLGRDLLALSAGVRFRLLSLLGIAAGDAALTLHLANAYDDVFAQVSPSVSFARDPAPVAGRVPFRPALSVGGYLVGLRRERVVVSGQLGISPEGIELGTLRFLFDLRDRPYGVR